MQRDKKHVEKYGFKIEMGIATTTRKEWVKVYRDPDGNVLTEEALQALAKKLDGTDENQRIKVDWELSGKTIECTKVEYATFQSEEEGQPWNMELFATPEGPILGMRKGAALEYDDLYVIREPCVVIYDGKGKINLTPIFNVVDEIRFARVIVRNIQVPNEILVGLYPAFVMQNRMMKYQLRPIVPFTSSPELGNEA